jgi:energy-coupling factor transporter ATP-binding protein EcfA2
MRDRFLVDAVGAVIEIDVSRRSADFRARAFDAWADARHEGRGVPDAVAVVPADTDDAAALSALSTEVTMKALAHRRHDRLWMLHAAGIAAQDGRVVVLSAASGTGKTTAARHLSQRYAYVSDETIGIDDTGRVVPYRKPLSIIEQRSAPKSQVALSSIDDEWVLPSELRVAKIVVIDRSADGPEEPVVEALDIADALALLGPQTSYLAEGPAPLRRIAALLAATGGAMRLRYREVAGIDGIIDELLRTPLRPVDIIPWETIVPVSAPPQPGGLVRAEVVDELAVDDRTVLLRRTPTGGQVHVLDGIGPAIWAAADGSALERIVEAVVAKHGQPVGMDARAVVDAAVQRLLADGLLRDAETPAS